MNTILEDIIRLVDDDTLLVVMGDHGMTAKVCEFLLHFMIRSNNGVNRVSMEEILTTRWMPQCSFMQNVTSSNRQVCIR